MVYIKNMRQKVGSYDSPFSLDSDIDPLHFIRPLSTQGGQYALLTPTETGLKKSIMDATSGVRFFLKEEGLHDYESQLQGPGNKNIIPAYFVTPNGLIQTTASLYRPVTKHGDPRIWFSGLGRYASPKNLLVLSTFGNAIYVINLSDPEVRTSFENDGFVAKIYRKSREHENDVKEELLAKIKEIHDLGWLPSTTEGDPGVGDTLEHALGISRNNSEEPDYKGIELKAKRITRHGVAKADTRATLFARVPDAGMTYKEIVETYGKVQIPRGQTLGRLQLYETFKTSRVNAYDLFLKVNQEKERVEIQFSKSGSLFGDDSVYVSSWSFEKLQEALNLKHHETFWVSAESKDIGGKEYFRYDVVNFTQRPSSAIFPNLIAADKVSVDLLAHIDLDTNKWRDHGMLWKMWKEDMPLLLGQEETYHLDQK